MSLEITVLRLPVPLSDLIDEAVGRFSLAHRSERMKANRRYHGADLWMVYTNEPVPTNQPAFLTRRVTVGLYSDSPDHLRFIPDIVVTRPTGRFTLRYEPERSVDGDHLAPVSVLQVRLATEPERTARELLDPHYLGSITAALERAWSEATELRPQQATQLIT